MRDNRKILMVLAAVVVLVILIFVIVGAINKNKEKVEDSSKTTIEDNKATGNVSVEQIEFKEITKVYDSGITTIRAKMYNKTKEVKNVTVKIILKDESGNELKNMIQVVENLQPDREKVLSTGIAGDYSGVKDIQFEIVK
ncbi:hypothetical protein D3C76_1096830 [compost metagenome]